MSFPIRLVAATEADLPRVLHLARASIAAVPAGDYTEAELALWRDHPAAGLDALLASGRHRLAMRGPVLLGCAGWMPAGEDMSDTAIMRAVFVSPRAQGGGVGTRMVRAIEADMLADGRPVVRIPAALCAVPFYRRLGYAEEQRAIADLPGGRLAFAWMTRVLDRIDRLAA